jgi:hypothetical protein
MSDVKKKYQVFVSSTFKDLQKERKDVIDVLLEIDCFPVGMEYFPASAESKWDVIKKLIDESDYLIVIIAGKYGSVDKDGISYTQKEYEYAIQQNIPAMAFIKDDDGLTQTQIEEDSDIRKKLNDFKAKLKEGKICSPWISPEQLCQKVITSVVNVKNDMPRPGWIRANTITKKEGNTSMKSIYKSIERASERMEARRSAKEMIDAIERANKHLD